MRLVEKFVGVKIFAACKLSLHEIRRWNPNSSPATADATGQETRADKTSAKINEQLKYNGQ
jgi:hypothetical protein